MTGHYDHARCWICDRLTGFDFDLGALGLTEAEVAEQLGLGDGSTRDATTASEHRRVSAAPES